MKVKVGIILQAQSVLKKIIEEKRPLPTKGKYRIVRLFETLTKEADIIEGQRVVLIKQFGIVNSDNSWQVEARNVERFQAEWNKILEDEIDVNIQPIPLSYLEAPAQVEIVGDDGIRKMIDPISLDELLFLGPLVMEEQ